MGVPQTLRLACSCRTNKGKAGPHGATGRQEFGVFCLTKGRERPQDANSELSLFTELANSNRNAAYSQYTSRRHYMLGAYKNAKTINSRFAGPSNY
jgi:hypothetical protein